MTKIFFLFSSILLLTQSCINFKPITTSDVKKVTPLGFSSEKVKLRIDIEIENPNKRAVKIKKHDVIAIVNGTNIGNINLQLPIVIEGKKSKNYSLDIEADGTKILEQLPIILLRGKIELEIKGALKVRYSIVSRRVPFQIKKTLSTKDLKL